MKKALVVLTAFSAMLNVVLFLYLFNSKQQEVAEVPQKNFSYLSPRIHLENQNEYIINFNPLRQALRAYVANSGKKIQIYFEYLPSGTSIGINDQNNFIAASLFKVPIAMTIMKKIDEEKIDENLTLVIQEKHIDKRFGNLWKKGPGTRISVKEAIEESLIQSDNTATNLLIDLIAKEGFIIDVYNTLDFPLLSKNGVETHISIKNYSSIFKSLYLSTYLPKEKSNYLLETLTKSPFRERLQSGLPENIKFAHKIGEYEPTQSSNKENYVHSDCGIVYLTKKPYMLCVAIEDQDEKTAEMMMKSISQTIYQYINDISEK